MLNLLPASAGRFWLGDGKVIKLPFKKK